MSTVANSMRARVASLSRSRTPDDPALVDARAKLAANSIERYIQNRLKEIPELHAEDIARIARLLNGGAR